MGPHYMWTSLYVTKTSTMCLWIILTWRHWYLISPKPPPSSQGGRISAAFCCLPDNKVTSFWWRMSQCCFVSEGGAIRCDPIDGESKYFQSIKVHWCCICSHPSSEVLTSPRESSTFQYSKSFDPCRSEIIVLSTFTHCYPASCVTAWLSHQVLCQHCQSIGCVFNWPFM